MSDSVNNPRLAMLLAQYAPAGPEQDATFLRLICIPAIMFAALGMLFAINFGIALIVIAAAILYYYRFGTKIAAGMAALLIVMLAAWMMLMPAHHLVAASIGIFLVAIAGHMFGSDAGNGSSTARPRLSRSRRILAGPVYAMVTIRERLMKN